MQNKNVKTVIGFLDSIPEMYKKGMEEITAEMFIRQLELRAVTIAPDEEGGIDCTLDYSLPQEYSDELLAVRFNREYQIYDISHES